MHRFFSTTIVTSRLLLCAVFLGCLNFLAAPLVSAETNVASSPDFDYRIAPRDQLRFQITGETEEPLLQRVSSGGEISVPLLGAVKVVGLTLRETETLIEKRYREDGYYLNPQVVLYFESYAPRVVSILGQVNNPVQVEFSIEREQMGIVAAITRAGGFTRVAQTDSVKVMRTIDGKETVFKVNVASYLNEAAKDQEFKLLPNDVVFVPERVF